MFCTRWLTPQLTLVHRCDLDSYSTYSTTPEGVGSNLASWWPGGESVSLRAREAEQRASWRRARSMIYYSYIIYRLAGRHTRPQPFLSPSVYYSNCLLLVRTPQYPGTVLLTSLLPFYNPN